MGTLHNSGGCGGNSKPTTRVCGARACSLDAKRQRKRESCDAPRRCAVGADAARSGARFSIESRHTQTLRRNGVNRKMYAHRHSSDSSASSSHREGRAAREPPISLTRFPQAPGLFSRDPNRGRAEETSGRQPEARIFARARGIRAMMSVAVTPRSPMSAAAISPARPCANTASLAAS